MDHWASYYARRECERDEPSSFARWCLRQGWVRAGDFVLDAGCGEGRDSACFAAAGATVAAVDAAEAAVARVRRRGLHGVCASLGALPAPVALFPACPDGRRVVAYARFSLHAVPGRVAGAFLEWCSRNADVLLIETRSVNDPRYGRGAPCGADAFRDGHYRRFTRLSDLTAQAVAQGFVVEAASEEWAAARAEGDAAVVNRVAAWRHPACAPPRDEDSAGD
jgi:SAM-dependent methyltransferase